MTILNDFVSKIKDFKFIEGNESEEESVGRFSVLITASKDLAQKNHSTADNIVSFMKKPYSL